ncbi:hypothetical protein SAMN05877838_2380 [Hoeflea halophila]|uniref:Uncharacterized protein n=1 Tax=Hoeflea halophila TaxID=714899 RepID=A0A286IBK1_9HYPH|nr:hypothetical protein [Hoeflea halophila]SOE17480.1 hypothetical protein SAMN05877838_2380 [Hoeflea halophila]
MTETMNKAPIFQTLVAGEARPDDGSVALVVATAKGEKFALEFDAKMVPATITALTSHLGQVVSALPENEQPNYQVLKTTRMGLAMNPQGELGLMLTLEGGGELTIAMNKAYLPVLKAQIEDAIRIAEDPRH